MKPCSATCCFLAALSVCPPVARISLFSRASWSCLPWYSPTRETPSGGAYGFHRGIPPGHRSGHGSRALVRCQGCLRCAGASRHEQGIGRIGRRREGYSYYEHPWRGYRAPAYQKGPESSFQLRRIGWVAFTKLLKSGPSGAVPERLFYVLGNSAANQAGSPCGFGSPCACCSASKPRCGCSGCACATC